MPSSSSSTTTSTATTTTSSSSSGRMMLINKNKKERDLIALRKLRHDNAPKAARLLRIMELAAKGLLTLHKRMDKEAIAIAGKDYTEHHDIAFLEVRSLASREEDDDEDESKLASRVFDGEPGIEDILTLANDTGKWAAECAAEREPPCLPSE